MEEIRFYDAYTFARHTVIEFASLVNDKDLPFVSIIADFYIARDIIKELSTCHFPIISVDIECPEISEYKDEYIITLTQSGLFCEKFNRNGKYIDLIADKVFVHEDCNSKCLKSIQCSEWNCVILDEV